MSLSSEDCRDIRSSCTLENVEGERFFQGSAWPDEGEAAGASVDPA